MPTQNHSSHATDFARGIPILATGSVKAEEIAAVLGEQDPRAVKTLLAFTHRTCYRPQDIMYHQGEASDTVFFVTDGLLKLVTYLPNGRARIVRLPHSGSVLGLSGLFGQQYEHTAVAVTPVATLRLPLSAVRNLRAQNMATYVNLAERWFDYLQDADRWITQFSTGPIRGRVARLLAFLSQIKQTTVACSGSSDGQLQLLTCEEIGSILGVSNESVSRILAEFKRLRILARHDGNTQNLYAADLARLRDIADE
jgi:CRP/FNR family transcriptional regulator, anaerobic regulatory protein